MLAHGELTFHQGIGLWMLRLCPLKRLWLGMRFPVGKPLKLLQSQAGGREKSVVTGAGPAWWHSSMQDLHSPISSLVSIGVPVRGEDHKGSFPSGFGSELVPLQH